MRCFYCMDEECKNMSFTWHVKVSVVGGTLMSRGSLFQAVEAKWLEGRFLTVICSHCILQSCVYTLHRIMMVYRNQLNCVLLSKRNLEKLITNYLWFIGFLSVSRKLESSCVCSFVACACCLNIDINVVISLLCTYHFICTYLLPDFLIPSDTCQLLLFVRCPNLLVFVEGFFLWCWSVATDSAS